MDPQIKQADRRKSFGRFLITCLLFPVSLNFMAYFGFVTATLRDGYSLPTFARQYGTGIFRYRILSRELVYLVYNIVHRFHRFVPVHPELARFLRTDSLDLYVSYFLLNTFFLTATSCVLYACLRSSPMRGSAQEKHLWLVFLIFLMVMTQYIVNPYDATAYFFLATSILLMLRTRGPMMLAGLAVVVVVAALNRETAAITISLFATLCVVRKRLFTRESLVGLALLIGAFLLPYILLRVVLGWDHAVGAGIDVIGELHQHNSYVGILLTLCLFGIVTSYQGAAQWRVMWIFLGISAPYILLVILTGIWFEVRLCVPLIICIVMLNLWNHEDDLQLTPGTADLESGILAERTAEAQESSI